MWDTSMVIFLLIAHSSTATSTPSAEHPLFLFIPHPSSNLPPHLWFVILLFGACVTSSYLRVKPKSLTRMPAVTSPPLLIFHLPSAGPLRHTSLGALHGLRHSTCVPFSGSTEPVQGSGQLSRPWGRMTWQPCRQILRIQPRGVAARWKSQRLCIRLCVH